ncbi:MAG: hypothetical protein ACK5UE_08950 [Chitinophagales bacterium]|jgi:hypothetical protein
MIYFSFIAIIALVFWFLRKKTDDSLNKIEDKSDYGNDLNYKSGLLYLDSYCKNNRKECLLKSVENFTQSIENFYLNKNKLFLHKNIEKIKLIFSVSLSDNEDLHWEIKEYIENYFNKKGLPEISEYVYNYIKSEQEFESKLEFLKSYFKVETEEEAKDKYLNDYYAKSNK